LVIDHVDLRFVLLFCTHGINLGRTELGQRNRKGGGGSACRVALYDSGKRSMWLGRLPYQQAHHYSHIPSKETPRIRRVRWWPAPAIRGEAAVSVAGGRAVAATSSVIRTPAASSHLGLEIRENLRKEKSGATTESAVTVATDCCALQNGMPE
jgi:hypothetical protein